MSDTEDSGKVALVALRREAFHRSMADAEAALRADPAAHAEYLEERDAWPEADLES